MTLTEVVARLVADLKQTGYPVVVGPPFIDPPAPPCLVVAVPDIADVFASATGGCEIAATTTDVLVVPATTTDSTGLLAMVDAVVSVAGGRVTAGAVEDVGLTDLESTAYRLTLED